MMEYWSSIGHGFKDSMKGMEVESLSDSFEH